jgi:hypothetical protein
MRACRCCKFYHRPLLHRILGMPPSLFAYCTNPRAERETVDPVTGELQRPTSSCWSVRNERTKCGPAGEWWTHK